MYMRIFVNRNLNACEDPSHWGAVAQYLRYYNFSKEREPGLESFAAVSHLWQVFLYHIILLLFTQLYELYLAIDNVVNSFRCIPVELRLAVTLWVLATGSGYRSVAHLFGIANSTCCEIFKETCGVIVMVLLPRYIRMPNNERLDEIIEGFETKFGFPNCGGAIDGTHIPIIAPQLHHTDYHNRKGYYSIVAQVVCDHEYRVMSICAGWPGRVHDARVLANSSIYSKGEDGTLFPNRPRRMGDIDVPVVLLGDPGYPL